MPFIKIEAVTEATAGASVKLTGRVGFDEDHTQRVSSPIDGRATALLVSPGDTVKVGQALVQLSSPHVGQLQSDAQKAAQDLSVAQKSMDRAHTLQKDGAISDKEVAQIEADYRKAKADVGSTSAQLRSLGVSASDPAVAVALRSQVSGTVVERNVLVGQEVRADGASPLITVSDLHTVWVLADVYEQDLKLVQKGAAVSITVPAYPGEKFPGTVVHLGEVLDSASHTVKLRCVVPNGDERLKPEMFAKVEVSASPGARVLTIPSKAVLSDSEHSRVIIDTGGGVFQNRVVAVGPEIDGTVRVLAGLQSGDRVVTAGALFLGADIENQ
ncbi:MAG TPA: efflux RND transporter periplasmic adaptor subunit [Polyangiaceae bacterium]